MVQGEVAAADVSSSVEEQHEGPVCRLIIRQRQNYMNN